MRLLTIGSLLLFHLTAFSQDDQPAVDLIEFIREIQQWHKNDNDMSLTFWIPNSYWRIASAGNGGIPQDAVGVLEAAMEDYVVIAAVDLDIQMNGSMTTTSEAVLRSSIALTDSKGNRHLPIAEDKLPADTKNIIQTIRPLFAQMIGQVGEGMHFFLFEVKDADGQNLINETQEGNLTVTHSGREFSWNLPLLTLLPPKTCPVDGEKMKGNWNFCPIHGDKLGN